MKDNSEKYLPIGSVVLLKEATKTVMITGYLQKEIGKNTSFYDYVGCLYPEGYISSDKNLLFNHGQIDKIFFTGYEAKEQEEFYKQLELAKIEMDKQNTFEQINGEIEML